MRSHGKLRNTYCKKIDSLDAVGAGPDRAGRMFYFAHANTFLIYRRSILSDWNDINDDVVRNTFSNVPLGMRYSLSDRLLIAP